MGHTQLGHANAAITLRVYAKLFGRAEHATRSRARQEAAFGNLLETARGNERETEAAPEGAEVAQLRGFRQ